MPTLGFLKKKRTKESTGQKDPSSPTTSQPNSPLTPTTSKGFDNSIDTVSTRSTAPTLSSVPSVEASEKDGALSPGQQQSTMQGVAQQQQQQSYVGPQLGGPSIHAESQHLPTINNLINPPQHESSAQPQQSQMMTNNASAAVNGNATQHDNSQQGAKQEHHHHQHHHQQQQAQHQGEQNQARQTKGKYSLNDFELLRTLGTGSFGRVQLVQSKHNQRFYAIKVLKKHQVVKMKQVEHTNDERRMLQDVKHPFLITLWGTFQDNRNLYMVMDFVEGGELFSLLRKSQRFPNPVAKFYAAEVTLALEYLHSKQIIYRDLKPENLLLDRHGHLKITDFGFAKRVPDITWTLCGTPDYLAPEVVSSKGYNKSVDWWSLGILIFEMLCGFTPFWDGGSPMKIYENILKGRVKYPPYIHPDAQDLLQRLITPDLTKRLGNLHGGSEDIKRHPWFAEVTWERLARKDIDAPYVPPVKAGVGDASQFDKYPEDPELFITGPDEHGALFPDF
ncbi:kinase-like domain-containing protein [Xylogone sp. PMI_703]|nr:kinase-like domain-containing protein [Xylogone sp. PMI_703]